MEISDKTYNMTPSALEARRANLVKANEAKMARRVAQETGLSDLLSKVVTELNARPIEDFDRKELINMAGLLHDKLYKNAPSEGAKTAIQVNLNLKNADDPSATLDLDLSHLQAANE